MHSMDTFFRNLVKNLLDLSASFVASLLIIRSSASLLFSTAEKYIYISDLYFGIFIYHIYLSEAVVS